MTSALLDILRHERGGRGKSVGISPAALETARLNLGAVRAGVRTAFLWDVGAGLDSTQKAANLCRLAAQSGEFRVEFGSAAPEATSSEMVVLVVDGDFLFADRAALLRWARSAESPVLVDVGGRVPAILTEEEARPVVDAVKAAIEARLANLDSVVVELNFTGANLTTAVGILLGYPVVYFWREDEGGGVVECGPELCVVAVNKGEDTLFQFSYPAMLRTELAPLVEKWARRLREKYSLLEVHVKLVSNTGNLAM